MGSVTVKVKVLNLRVSYFSADKTMESDQGHHIDENCSHLQVQILYGGSERYDRINYVLSICYSKFSPPTLRFRVTASELVNN